ncbi:MAG: Crp/Fnr family transcriptional regulator [Pirellulales bacterium]|nr:Crp/Fnr family transcriptional regulator [Pirellulales bacterium]
MEAFSLPPTMLPSSAELLGELASLENHQSQVTLFREGEHHAMVYWIQEGRVRLEMSRKHWGSAAMMTVGAGDILAWSALLGDGRMTATAITTVPTTLIVFNAEELLQLCEENHDIGFRVMHTTARLISKRLVATRLQLLDLFSQSKVTDPDGCDQ